MRNVWLALCVFPIGMVQAWVHWPDYWEGGNPGFYINTSTPTTYRPLVLKGAEAWKMAGGGRFPTASGAVTGRDCGAGDSWFYDDDDGYNVVDYWDRCNDNSAYNGLICGIGAGKYLAWTYHLDYYGTGDRLAEVDIVMCNNIPWSSDYFGVSGHSYQGWMTHEFGHAMGIAHTNNE